MSVRGVREGSVGVIVAYIRVSTEEQARSGLGLDDQRKAIVEAVARFGIPLRADIVVDDGHSAGKDVEKRDRLGFALSLLKRGDILLVVKRDRLSRGDPVAMAKIQRRVAAKKSRILSLAGEGTERDDASAVLEGRLHDAVAEHERGVTAERTSRALQAKRARGELAGGVPYGWKAVVDESVVATKRGHPGRRLTAVDVEQRTIALMRQLRGCGLSLRQVGTQLVSRGIRPRSGGESWHPDSIRGILGETKPTSVTGQPPTVSDHGCNATGPKER